jgi:DNA-binding IclR family transcriptional regulator
MSKAEVGVVLSDDFYARLDQIRQRGYEMMASIQTAGVYNLSAPVLGPDGKRHCRIDRSLYRACKQPCQRRISPKTISLLVETARQLSLLAGSDVTPSAD